MVLDWVHYVVALAVTFPVITAWLLCGGVLAFEVYRTWASGR